MKKETSKRFLASILCTAVLIGSTACSGAASSTSSPKSSAEESGSSAASAASDASATTAGAVKYKAPDKKPEGQPVHLIFSTNSVGSSNYTIASGLAPIFKDYLPEGSSVDVQPTSPGGMGAPYLFASGKADIAFVNGAPAKWAWETGTLNKPKTQEFRAMVGHLCDISAVNYITQSFIDKYGTDKIEEIFKKKLPIRIGCSPVGSMDYQCLVLLLKSQGVTEADIKSWGGDIVHGGGSDLESMVKDGKLDMVLDHTSAQSSTMTETAMTCKLHFTQWEDSTLSYFDKQGFERIILPANSFKNQTKNVLDAGTPDCLFVNKKLSTDVVYDLTKAICEQRDYLASQYSSMSAFDPKLTGESSARGGVPLHEGAKKYFLEKGYAAD